MHHIHRIAFPKTVDITPVHRQGHFSQFAIDFFHNLTLYVSRNSILGNVCNPIGTDRTIKNQGLVWHRSVAHLFEKYVRTYQVGSNFVLIESRVHLNHFVLLSPWFSEKVVRVLVNCFKSDSCFVCGKVFQFCDRIFEYLHRWRKKEFLIVWHVA